jgi:hypothetical protein
MSIGILKLFVKIICAFCEQFVNFFRKTNNNIDKKTLAYSSLISISKFFIMIPENNADKTAKIS